MQVDWLWVLSAAFASARVRPLHWHAVQGPCTYRSQRTGLKAASTSALQVCFSHVLQLHQRLLALRLAVKSSGHGHVRDTREL